MGNPWIKTTAFAALLAVAGCDQKPDKEASQPSVDVQSTNHLVPAVEDVSSTRSLRPLWGDTHVHTSYSFDVYLFGTPGATPETAYRFAKGEAVISPTTGETWQLDRPLDFLVVADHAEALGNAAQVFAGDPKVTNTKSGTAMRAVAGDPENPELLSVYSWMVNTVSAQIKDEVHGVTAEDFYVDLHGGTQREYAWHDIIDSADKHNDPGKFTAFIGWEWTSAPGGANLHRVVFTPADGTKAKQFMPFSQFESDRPEDLWAWLSATRDTVGADFVAMPHNSNVSMGRMFQLEDSDGNPIDAEYARRRAEWERVVEMTQIKGDSETHPLLSPTDEFAEFETWNFVMIPSGPTPDPVAAEYVRSALKQGLEIEARTGVNPYKFGMIGSTDSHTGLSTSSEENFAGKGQKDSRPEIRSNPTGLGSSRGWDMGAAGLVAAWAPNNTRQAIFDTFKRREVYATTGTRMSLRFFAGADLQAADFAPKNYPASAYEKGVPMGGDISALDGTPRFMVQALKDPDGANLDRIQIIKGWVDTTGAAHEKVFDVVWAGDRSLDSEGRLPPIGNTVDVTTGAYTNTIGSNELKTVWSDPEFDATQSAFYYVRVLEIPTPRYSLLNSIALGIDVSETGRPATLQERAYSSPIWYSAGGG